MGCRTTARRGTCSLNLCAGFLTGCFRVLEALITRRPRTRMLRRFERPGLAVGAAGPFSETVQGSSTSAAPGGQGRLRHISVAMSQHEKCVPTLVNSL